VREWISSQPETFFMDGMNKWIERLKKKMCCHKWWLRRKISVQSVREINFFHSDITVIISHCHKLISYNWRPYLSITPRSFHRLRFAHAWICLSTQISLFLIYLVPQGRAPRCSAREVEVHTLAQLNGDGITSPEIGRVVLVTSYEITTGIIEFSDAAFSFQHTLL